MLKRTTLALAAMIASACGTASAKEIIVYRTDCKVVVGGKISTYARIITSFTTWLDANSSSLNQTFAIIDPYYLTFSGGNGSSSSVAQTFVQCCKTFASAAVKGSTDYSFTGDTISMDFSAWSSRYHANKVERGFLSSCIGKLVETDSDYTVDNEPLTVNVPFKLADYGFAWTLCSEYFQLKRADSGPTTGSTIGVWIIWRDENCNCEIDDGDWQVGGQKGIVYPNDWYDGGSECVELKPACYIAQFIYITNSHLDVDSKDCTHSVKDDSQVDDKFVTRLYIF